jgi:hypothetical protein
MKNSLALAVISLWYIWLEECYNLVIVLIRGKIQIKYE